MTRYMERFGAGFRANIWANILTCHVAQMFAPLTREKCSVQSYLREVVIQANIFRGP